jgi:carbon storage regulator
VSRFGKSTRPGWQKPRTSVSILIHQFSTLSLRSKLPLEGTFILERTYTQPEREAGPRHTLCNKNLARKLKLTLSHSWRNVMLVLSRKPGEQIIIGNGITVTVVEVIGNRVRLGITAPDQVRILRGELAEWQKRSELDSEAFDSDAPLMVLPR